MILVSITTTKGYAYLLNFLLTLCFDCWPATFFVRHLLNLAFKPISSLSALISSTSIPGDYRRFARAGSVISENSDIFEPLIVSPASEGQEGRHLAVTMEKTN